MVVKVQDLTAALKEWSDINAESFDEKISVPRGEWYENQSRSDYSLVCVCVCVCVRACVMLSMLSLFYN